MTLLLHEVHTVAGASEDDFEEAYRAWMSLLGADGRLLYFLSQAHGGGPSYTAVTITAFDDGAAWERVARRTVEGDLASWAADTDAMRYQCTAKLLLPVAWSPLQSVDLAAVPVGGVDHEPTLYMEDTGWPDSTLDEYTDFWGRDYYPMLAAQPAERRLLSIEACWVTAAGYRPEAILWQRIHDLGRLGSLFMIELPPSAKAAGTYMAEGLKYRDQWESRLLRTARWSPWA
jgi:hypothetical protein